MNRKREDLKYEVERSSSVQPLNSGVFPPAAWVWAITILGGLLRFFRFDVMGLWIDEGFSLMFARMSWAGVFGFEGVYDSFSHPPLYYATTKLFALAMPEVAAGRVVSVVAGTLTIPVLYALTRKLTGAWVGIIASAVLAISPLHLWYSRDARMYAATMLCVAISWWALVEFHAAPRRKWAIIYSLTVLLAMYYDYSAIYALVPQLIVLAVILRKYGRRASSLLIALGVAIIGYLPWIPAWLSAVSLLGGSRVGYLGVEFDKIPFYLMGVGGVAERGYFLGPGVLWWESWTWLYWVFGALAMAVLAVGWAIMAQRHRFGLLVVGAMLATVIVAVLLSLVSPGLGTRTIMYAVMGWAILLGVVIVGGVRTLPAGMRIVGRVAAAGILLFSLLSGWAMYTMADKQRWQDLASDVAAVRRFDKPVLLPRPIDFNIIDAYRPGSLDGVAVTSTIGLKSDVVWFAYHDSPVFAPLHDELKTLGYERLVHKFYYTPLYLDLYAKPGADVGELEKAIGAP